jgi:alpha-L-fucosidase
MNHSSTSDRLAWHREARFGMSLHWGLYSLIGRGEWVRAIERLTVEQYAPYFNAFRPDPGCCREWAKLARQAGMKYILLTAKHHDGFCLFDSKLTAYKSTNTPAGRDLVREFVDAARVEGLRVGLYYSLIDWHHDDYPAYMDRQHPLRHDPAAKGRDARCDWSRYIRYMHGQVEELLTRYGRIDLLAFDFSYWDYTGGKWGAAELMRLIRRLQPDIVVNDRLGIESIKQASPPAFVGDIDHVEQDVPREPVRNVLGQSVPWESWLTINNSWSYNPTDRDFKSPQSIVRTLVNCVSKGGNLLFNVAPDPAGHIQLESSDILHQVGRWLERNGESIYGAGPANWPKPEWGRFTQRGQTLYAHLLDQPMGHLTLPNLRGRVKDPIVLATGEPGFLSDYWNPGIQTFDEPNDIFFNVRQPVAYTWPLPDDLDTVVRLTLTTEDEPEALLEGYRLAYQAAVARKPLG